MATFNEHLLSIHEQISIRDEDRKPYTEMFETIKSWLMQEMRKVNPLFDTMFKGTQLFGSYPNGVRIIKPSEFDVSILLQVPYPLQLVTNPIYSGFARISRDEKYSNKTDREIFTNNSLDHERIKDWITSIIRSVLTKTPKPAGYSVEYTCRNVAHNIYVHEGHKTISIDFVPSITIRKEDINGLVKLNRTDIEKDYMDKFLAIPQSVTYISDSINMFRLVNPEAERDKIWDKQNLKVVYRLLKSIRDKHDLPRLKSYFLTAMFLLEVEKQSDKFWHEPIEDIFFHMLKLLVGYFRDNNLPFYWDPDYNLLNVLKPSQRQSYKVILTDIYTGLKRISEKNSISYAEVVSYFQTNP